MEPEEPKELGAAPLWAEASKRQEQAPWHYYWQPCKVGRSLTSGASARLYKDTLCIGFPHWEIQRKFLHPIEFCQLGLSEFTLGILECNSHIYTMTQIRGFVKWYYDMDDGLKDATRKLGRLLLEEFLKFPFGSLGLEFEPRQLLVGVAEMTPHRALAAIPRLDAMG